MSSGSNYLDPTGRAPFGSASARRGRLAKRHSSASDTEKTTPRIITDQLIDNSLCGYRFAGLPRTLAIAREAKTSNARIPVAVVYETPVSALVDGGNNVGYVTVYRGADSSAPRRIETPPLFAIPICTGITNTFGGIAIDGHGRVTRPDGSSIAGLYAADGCTGGLEGGGVLGYVGGSDQGLRVCPACRRTRRGPGLTHL